MATETTREPERKQTIEFAAPDTDEAYVSIEKLIAYAKTLGIIEYARDSYEEES